MEDLLNINSDIVSSVLSILLKDKTTLKNILWGASSYAHLGPDYSENKQITVDQVKGCFAADIQPRVAKDSSIQALRTKKKAEVFTPSWICNKMNNYCDEDWFDRPNVFNIEDGESWASTEGKIEFPDGKSWKDYIDSRRLEITCGEAPFIVSRYDPATGEIIPLDRRIGILDRKMRVLNENARNELEWVLWAKRAYQSVYGYEYQGDNLLIARINLINTFADYLSARWKRLPTEQELHSVATIIAWNFWQMNGLKNTTILGEPSETSTTSQISAFDDVAEETKQKALKCRIFDWRADRSIFFTDIIREGDRK